MRFFVILKIICSRFIFLLFEIPPSSKVIFILVLIPLITSCHDETSSNFLCSVPGIVDDERKVGTEGYNQNAHSHCIVNRVLLSGSDRSFRGRCLLPGFPENHDVSGSAEEVSKSDKEDKHTDGEVEIL